CLGGCGPARRVVPDLALIVTIPARPSDTSATRCWNPSRSAALAPDWPWSMSITVIWSAAQPSAVALPRRSYWRIADSVLWMTCLRLDWRTYKSAVLDRWAAVTFDAAVSGSIGSPSAGMAGYGDGLVVAAPASTRAASMLMSSAATG